MLASLGQVVDSACETGRVIILQISSCTLRVCAYPLRNTGIVGTVTRLWAEWSGIQIPEDAREILSFSKMPSPTLRHTHPVIIKSIYSLCSIGLTRRASMHCCLQLSPPISFHDLLVLLISSSIVLRHVLFGLPLLQYPWGFQSNAVFSIALVSLRNVCTPI